MGQQIPWHILGPAGCLAIVILIIVFAFLVKFQKKNTQAPTIPKDLNTISKKTLCFKHEGDIAANSKAIEMIGDQLKTVHENNRQDHGKIFKMMEDNQKDIIKHIDAKNADG